MTKRAKAAAQGPAMSEQLCFAVYSANHAFTRVYKPLLDPLGLTYPQYIAMLSLWRGDGRTVGGLGEALGLESSTLTPLLKRLEAAGLVERRRDPRDERQVRISLTQAGKDLREKAAGVPACIAAATGLTQGQARNLLEGINGLRAALARDPAGAQM